MTLTSNLIKKTYAYLDDLNSQQREAVESLKGPVLVLSGAGTGKTRVLTTRIAHLLSTNSTKPWNVMAVTFTNKAAREMKERVSSIIGSSSEQVMMGTFHSLGAKMLRKHSELVGLKPNFSIIDTDDQLKLLKQILGLFDIDLKQWPPRLFVNIISQWKDRGLISEKISEDEAIVKGNGKALDVYKEYQKRLLQTNSADFGDLLLYPLEILLKNQEIRLSWQSRISHILVDEYQDTNTVQYLWLRLLSGSNDNLCCVGDDDQSIYGWRGAEVKNILGFEKDFPNAKIIRLEQNYRSTDTILAAANSVISNNKNRLGKKLWTKKKNGKDIQVFGVYDSSEEARYIGNSIEQLMKDNILLSEIAVLVRTTAQTREIEERFIAIGLPYKVVGAKFFERQEIRDAISYIRIIANSSDDLAFERIINLPRRGIGPTSINTLIKFSRKLDIPLFNGAQELIATNELRSSSRDKISKFLSQIIKWRSEVNQQKPEDLISKVLNDSGYYDMWKSQNIPESETRLENLKELISAISGFDTLQGFLEHVSLMTNTDRNNPKGEVTLMTLHAAKGLEFESVFLAGWEEGLFPSSRSLDENGNNALEEERRLAYVGLTRAKSEVFISFAANRRVHGLWMSSIPSRFLREIPKENIIEDIAEGLSIGNNLSNNTMNYNYENKFEEPGYGPGWKRMSDNKGKFLPNNKNKNSRNKLDSSYLHTVFKKGDRVYHLKFGMGNVIISSGDKLEVSFDKAGYKKIKSDFLSKK